MINDKDKLDLLELYSYKHRSKGDLRFNRKTKKIFSDIAIQDHDIYWLREKLEEESTSEIMVYFNEDVNSQRIESLRNIFNL